MPKQKGQAKTILIIILAILVVGVGLYLGWVLYQQKQGEEKPQFTVEESAFSIPPINPPFIEEVPEGVLDKINRYVIDYSGISEDYFKEHYKILNAYKTCFNCGKYEKNMPPLDECSTSLSDICFIYLPLCDYTYAVHVYWEFSDEEFSVIVGGVLTDVGQGPPMRFVFIIENNQVKKSWNNAIGSSHPIPKFREIHSIVSSSQLNSWIKRCGEFTSPYGLKLTQKSEDSDTLSLVYYSWGEKSGLLSGDVEFFADLETGEKRCRKIFLER